VHDYEIEQDGEDVGAGVAVCYALSCVWWWRPVWTEDAGFDCVVNLGGVRFGIGAEKLRVELGEDVSDAICFVGELDAE